MTLEEQVRKIIVLELKERGIKYDKVSVIILPFKTVGVQGDFRTYEHPVEIGVMRKRKFLIIDYSVLADISTRITNEINSINRVVYTLPLPIKRSKFIKFLDYLKLKILNNFYR